MPVAFDTEKQDLWRTNRLLYSWMDEKTTSWITTQTVRCPFLLLLAYAIGFTLETSCPIQRQHKVSAVVYALLGFVPCLAWGSAIPSAEGLAVANHDTPVFPVSQELNLLSRDLLTKQQADDKWSMVIYNNGKEGQQCGGVPNDIYGKDSTCWGLGTVVSKAFTDLKVSATMSFAN
ncbi:hypothetical protein LZ32DRAFT_662319 [Colletotrichum eremochloae]|nr:hypothetical protein LZ32DRAFT_662319 [Colletotrichum eremochloae]